MSVGEAVLETRDLGYAYTEGRFAVRHLTLDLHRGEVLGLLGRNGAGKTTTVRLLTTLLPPTEGTAILLGQDVRTGGRALRSRLGVVLQAESLDFVSVERNLTLYAFLWGVDGETAKARGEEMIDLFELDQVRRRKPWALSGGERRRFQVARELMHEMDILFLDEPTVGLDAVARQRILRYLRQRARAGLAIIFTTHILHEADALCDRIAVLHEGALKALDTPGGLKLRFGGAREVSATFSSPLGEAQWTALREEVVAAGANWLPPSPGTPVARDRIDASSEKAEELVSRLAQWANLHHVSIVRLAVQEQTLEGAFLGLVHGAEDDEEVPKTPPAAFGPSGGRLTNGGLR